MTAKRRWTEMTKDDSPLTQLINAYQLYNRAVGKSGQTVQWYESRLGLYARFLGEEPTLAAVNADSARAYIVHLQDRTDRHAGSPFVKNPRGKLSTAYIHGCVRAIRAFANWLYSEEYTDSNRLRIVKPPKVQQKVVPVLTDPEIRALLARFDQDEAFGARNYAMVFTLLDCGLRASELSGLALTDAHLKEGYLKVLGKGNKERLVPLGAAAQKALLRWRDYFRPQFEPGETESLFVNANGDPLTVQALQEVKRAAKSSGVPRVYCHLLRHTFATRYLVEEVGDPFRLQQILGHTSLEMVRHYVAMASVEASLLERRSSPMDLLLNPPTSPLARHTQPKRAPAVPVPPSPSVTKRGGGRLGQPSR